MPDFPVVMVGILAAMILLALTPKGVWWCTFMQSTNALTKR